GAVTGVGQPASYSRKGPGLDGVVKPDVCHYSGDVDTNGSPKQTGIQSLDVDGSIARSVGTSYSTPVVAATAASVIGSFSSADVRGFSDPLLARALLVHASRQGLKRIPDTHRHYYGNGVPPSSPTILSDSPD